GHHYPTYQPLHTTQYEQYDKRQDHLLIEITFYQKVDKTYNEHHTQHTCPQAVKPLPKENEFEIAEFEMTVEVFVLSYLFVTVESFVPFLFIHRRQSAHNRFPLCNR